MIKFFLKHSYAFYLALCLGFFYGFADWQFWWVLLPVIVLTEELHK